MSDRSPVTVGELVDALATYPRDALVVTAENGYGGGTVGVQIDRRRHMVWSGVTSAGNWMNPEDVPFEDERPRPMSEDDRGDER